MAVITELRFVHVGYRFARSIVSNKTYIRKFQRTKYTRSDFANLISRYPTCGVVGRTVFRGER